MILKKTRLALPAAILLLSLIIAYFWPKVFFPTSGPVEKITVGTLLIGVNGLLFIAKDKGFDKAHGLELNITVYQTGIDTVREVRANRLDLASCAEFVFVNEILAGNTDLRCLSALGSGDIIELIARRDRGISRPEDLRGKTIGVPGEPRQSFFWEDSSS